MSHGASAIGTSSERRGVRLRERGRGGANADHRFVRPSGGFTFRAAFTPLFGEGGFLPWARVAFSYSF